MSTTLRSNPDKLYLKLDQRGQPVLNPSASSTPSPSAQPNSPLFYRPINYEDSHSSKDSFKTLTNPSSHETSTENLSLTFGKIFNLTPPPIMDRAFSNEIIPVFNGNETELSRFTSMSIPRSTADPIPWSQPESELSTK
jgi:hypothetical protein